MGLPTHISTTGAQGSSIVKNANFYATTLANDIAVETLALNGTSPTATAPSGWTEFANVVSADDTYRLVSIWKRCAANEADHNWTISNSANRFIISTIIRGCVTSGDPWDVLTSDVAALSTALSISLGTTIYSDCLYLAHIGCKGNTNIGSAADANLSSLTEQYDTNISGNSRQAYTGGLATAGAGGTLTGTLSTGSQQAWMALALKSTTSVTSVSTSDFFNFL